MVNIPEGFDGVAATLRLMRKIAVEAVTDDPTATVVLLTRQIFQSIPERRWADEITALHEFVRDHIRYTLDPDDMEMLQTPLKTLEIQQGDCDDKSTLLAAMLKAGGHPSRFCAVGMNGEMFSHVLVEARHGDEWIPLETILDVPAGWEPPNITSRYYHKV
jgi:transglutaminase-like putative cysteine protease